MSSFWEELLKTAIEEMVDEAIRKDLEIKAIQEKEITPRETELTALKQKIERQMIADECKKILGKLWQATLVEWERKELDLDGLFAECGIPKEEKFDLDKVMLKHWVPADKIEDIKKKFTVTKALKPYMKITPKK